MNPPSPINRRDFSKQLAAGLGGALVAPGLAAAASSPRGSEPEAAVKPNIVFILSDQHAYKYCGFMGHPIVRTPNLDRIAARGVVFQNTYCNNPVCAPARAGMLSGAYGSDVNSFCNATTWDGSLPAWPAMLRDAGYLTFGTGKMDCDDRFDMGFQQNGVTNGHATNPDITAFFRRPLCARPSERSRAEGRPRDERHKDATQATKTAEFIRSHKPGSGPWAAYCGWLLPHPAFVGLRHYFEDYMKRSDLPNIPPGHLEDLHFVFQELRHFKNVATPIPEDRQRRARAAYYAMITELDEYVGQIWTAVEETGQLENTIFVYTSDHGESLGDHGLWLKNNLYDVAARVPMTMAGPGIPPGSRVETPVSHADLIRTFLEWGGARTHDKLRGHSLIPLMQGRQGNHPGWAYSESHSEGNCTGSFMIRKGDWKYIHVTWHDGLLFNLGDDPGEFHNRFYDPEAQSVVKELQEILHSQVDPIEVTERAFAVQQKRMDRLAAECSTPEEMLGRLRGRLGEGQSVALLNAYYGRTFDYTPQETRA